MELKKNDLIKYNNLKYKTKLNEKYYCKACNHIFDDVYQAECGCRFCLICLIYILAENEKCQTCEDEFKEKVKVKDKAFQKELDNSNVECFHCNWSGILIDYLTHYIEFHNQLICKYCKNEFIEINSFRKHVELYMNGTCAAINQQKCIYNTIGCGKSHALNLNMEQHLKEDVAFHLNYVYNFMQNEFKELKRKLNSCTNADKTNFNEDSDLKMLTCENKESQMDINIYKGSFFHDFNKCIYQLDQMKQETDLLRKRENELHQEVENLKKLLLMSQTAIIGLEQRLFEQDKNTYNGVLVWKITNVKNKILDAKSGKQPSFYSTPFYSHFNGYKMCVRLYFNGDGMGRGTHVSAFFVLMKGEFDALLNWPFRQKVTFVLIDQSNSETKENVVDIFKPDLKSNSFVKPVSDMNIASGLPMFCSLVKLHSTNHEYIKDDTMYLKTIVDTRELIDV